MKSFVTIGILLLLMSGCKSAEPLAVDALPILVSQAPLPPLPPTVRTDYLRLELQLLVNKNGEVERAHWLTGSGFGKWDSTALMAVTNWKYTPARYRSEPIALWVRQVIRVQMREPMFLWLAEIACPDKTYADSLYAILREGGDFETVAREHSKSESAIRGGVLGKMDIRIFPFPVQDEIAKLRVGEISKPIRIGNSYVIIKNMPAGSLRSNDIRSL